MTKKKLLKLPYGDASFRSIKTSQCAYVDKTKFIEVLESENTLYPFIVRPRRFGKTLFADMLSCYYDKAMSPFFDENFKDTYIHEHPTPLQGKFRVLRFNFSGIDLGFGLSKNFNECLADAFSNFFKRYPADQNVTAFLEKDFESPAAFFKAFCRNVSLPHSKDLFVIIDEYDQFANEILSKDLKVFREMTSSTGFFKNFYSALKDKTSDTVARIFITGVSSISLDSITSGFNIALNLSNTPAFAAAFGFTQDELLKLIEQTVDLDKYGHSAKEVLERMQIFFNGYRFSRTDEQTVFNSSMSLYYLNALATTDTEPDNMFDSSVIADLSKISGILSLAKDKQLTDRIINDVLEDRSIRFSALSENLNMNSLNSLDRNELLSVLFYLGYLTWSHHEKFRLVCPNKAVRELFFRYFFKYRTEIGEIFFIKDELYDSFKELKAGNIMPLLSLVSEKISDNTGLHTLAHFNENCIQCAVQMAVLLSSKFKATCEAEVLGTGFADLLIEELSPSTNRIAYLLEFKYLKKSTFTQAELDNAVNQAKSQLKEYALNTTLSKLPNLKLCAIVFAGTKLVKVVVLDKSTIDGNEDHLSN